MISRWIEQSCLSIPGMDRLYLDRYVWIKRSEKQLQFAMGLSTPPSYELHKQMGNMCGCDDAWL